MLFFQRKALVAFKVLRPKTTMIARMQCRLQLRMKASGITSHAVVPTRWPCGLTFELRGAPREGAWPAQRMMTLAGARAKRLAGVRPFERRVSRHSRGATFPLRRAVPSDWCVQW